jgi:hypothetical protein
MMCATTTRVTHNPAAVFPAGLGIPWETETRVVWNEQERAAEEQELVYEVSWIPELAAWRRCRGTSLTKWCAVPVAPS